MPVQIRYDTVVFVFSKDYLSHMSKLDPEIIQKTAKLAQLDVSENETAALAHDLENIFHLFESLNREDISQLEPLSNPLGETQALRQDVAVKRDLLASIQQNAPLAEDNFITVPKVIE